MGFDGTVAHGCHGETKNLTAKPNAFTAKAKFSRQNQIPHDHGKTKNLTAKPNRATAEVTSSFQSLLIRKEKQRQACTDS